MSTRQTEQNCTTPEECGIVTERNRYFTGKYMTARDFSADQSYFLSRHRLHNRLFHGQGVVCGLEVVPHENVDCWDSWVVVNPGVAIDCCGRELVIEEKTPVRIWDPPELKEDEPARRTDQDYKQDQAETVQSEQAKPEEEEEKESPQQFLLFLRYEEKLIEKVPALYADDRCDPHRLEANRLREVACFDVLPWREIDQEDERPCREDCADSLPGPGASCLELNCPKEGQIVPLAIITPRIKDGQYFIGADEIDTTIQHQLTPPPEFLTHICDFNWDHGCELTLSQLRDKDKMNGRLEVYFDRKLKVDNLIPGVGVSENTFVVQYTGAPDTIEFLRPAGKSPWVEITEDYCKAVFVIDPDKLESPSRRSTERSIAYQTVFIRLKCDFILDCRDMPVDGDHLQGKAQRREKRTGNGLPGGIFESWFYVVPDYQSNEEAS